MPGCRQARMTSADAGLFQPSPRDVVTGELLPACAGSPPYFDDYKLDEVYTIGPRMVTEAEILAFGREFDRQYIHTDPLRAQEGLFGGVIASGWHIMSLAMQMLVGTVIHEDTSIASPGVDQIAWKKPLFPGDVVTLAARPTSKRKSRADSGRGLVRFALQLTNESGGVIMTAGLLGYVRCHPKV